ncbi:hypothetical protein APSETT444_002338 [Aspergillus pseudonomiae]
MSHTEAARTDSLGEQETRGDVETDKKAKNRRPANYSECADKAQRTPVPIPDKVKSSFKSSNQQPNPTWMKYRDEETNETICRLSFKIPENIEPPVFMYYRLTNFYQNHRRYVKSLDIDQLKGKAVDNKTIDGGSCDPLKLDDSGKAYYPCGLIANSMFNDTIKSPELLNDGNDDDPVVYVMTNKGIAWDSDKELIKTTQYKPGQVVPPPNWQARYPHNYTTEIPDLHDNEEFMSRGFCATSPPTESLKAEYRRLSALGFQNHNPVDSESRAAVAPIEIDTWFHIVTGEAETESISDEMVADQNAYQNATISYRLQGVTRSVNDTWARNEDEMAMKTALRRGSYRTLNVYFHTDLQGSASAGARASDIVRREMGASQPQSTSMLGFCTLPDPSINASSPRSTYIKDGCNVLAETMPGGSLVHYNRGGTAIHEIGHWNGLLHIFEGESCSPDNEGDFIADTPQQSKPTEGCPAQKDSCPELPGLDAIHNFMDYSSDECYDSFTPDQVSRMRSMWFAMRDGK